MARMRDDDVAVCLRVLEEMADRPEDDPDRERVRRAVSAFLKRTRRRDRAADAAVLAGAVPGAAAAPPVPQAAPPPRTDGATDGGAGDGRREDTSGHGDTTGHGAGQRDRDGDRPRTAAARVRDRLGSGLRSCYVCKARYPVAEIDAFYHRLCPPCAEENRRHRHARADLTGRRAIVTGGRVKAGFELVLKLLRDGASVTALTRFPADARRRFAAVPDRGDWWDRLTVTGMDLRDIPALVRWCDALTASGEHLDILVNLAAQTLRHPPEAYAALLAGEGADAPALAPAAPAALPPGAVPPHAEAAEADTANATPVPAGLPRGEVDVAGLLPDPSPHNSWTRLVHEVDPIELLEVQLINVTAPFLLIGRLRPLLERSPHPRRYVVNVSAAEGRFDRPYKGPEHPHTNMAKAALNMLTLTTAPELAARGVYVSSVDPGWFTDQLPTPARERRAAFGFRPPLDAVDAAARVYHPIVRGERDGDPPYGRLLKDYRVTGW